jgi:hypothetical protein
MFLFSTTLENRNNNPAAFSNRFENEDEDLF